MTTGRPPARLDRDGAVVTITLDRPTKRNAIDSELAALVDEWLVELDADPEVGCLVLTGSDPAFCAGLDLVEFRRTAAAPVGAGQLIRRVADVSTPVVAAVNGPAYTGGLELLLGCDVIVASERASFADTHVKHGLMPGGGMSVRLAEAVGVRRAKRISYTAQPVGAEEALRIGLVDLVVEPALLLEAALAIAHDIAAAPRAGVRAMKDLYREAVGAGVVDGLRAEREAQGRWREIRGTSGPA
jgi:enoyl-CoA hydratase